MALLDRAVQVVAMAPWWLAAAIGGNGFKLPERGERSDASS